VWGYERDREVGMVIHFNLVEVSIEKELFPLKWSNAKKWKESVEVAKNVVLRQ
jgi:hypothetical protein